MQAIPPVATLAYTETRLVKAVLLLLLTALVVALPVAALDYDYVDLGVDADRSQRPDLAVANPWHAHQQSAAQSARLLLLLIATLKMRCSDNLKVVICAIHSPIVSADRVKNRSQHRPVDRHKDRLNDHLDDRSLDRYNDCSLDRCNDRVNDRYSDQQKR